MPRCEGSVERALGWNTAYLSLGSNLGPRTDCLDSAVILLQNKDSVIEVLSRTFETEPVGTGAQPWFLNSAARLRTRLGPVELLHHCLRIEKKLGRQRSTRNAPRTADLDILLYEDRVMDEEELIIPHPRMIQRRFVLEALVEIAPNVIHPVAGRSIRALLETCPDSSVVRVFPHGAQP